MSARELTRALVETGPPRVGVCGYCGASAPGRTVCAAHSDLPRLDPTTTSATTRATTTPPRSG